MSMSTFATPSAIDLRAITPRSRASVVLTRFDALQAGESLQLLDDHDPQPLRAHFEARAAGQFEWVALESGPAAWRVQLTRVGVKPPKSAADSCCSGGACCG